MGRGLALFGWMVLAGCILQEVSLDGKSCPCASGFVCDEEIDVCVRELAGRPDAGEDAGFGDALPDAAALPPGCARDTDCDPQEICVASACEPGCEVIGCEGDEVCDPSGRCFSAEATCAGPSECNPPHQVCIAGKCEPGCAVGGGSCTENRICDPGTGYCEAAPSCDAGSLCPDRQFFCSSGACLRRCDVPGAAPCLGNTTCNQNGRCEGAQLGEACSNDVACATGLCYSIVDPPSSFCSTPCGRTADCPIGFGCLPTGKGYRVCVPGDAAGASFATPSGETCEEPGNACQSSICGAAALTCVERCARPSHCDEYATGCIVRQTQPGGAYTQECDAGAGTGLAGESCVVNADCASGICNKYQNRCADSCCTDTDCLAGESCLVYDLDNQTVITICQPSGLGTVALGMPCSDASECESGTCTPESPFNLTGPKICSVRCCTHHDCSGLTGGYCHPIPGVLPGTQAATCFPG